VAAGHIDHGVVVQHAEVDVLAALRSQPLHEGLHQAGQAGGVQVALAQAQHTGRQPEALAVAVGIAEVHQAQQVAPCGGAGHAGTLGGLGSCQPRVLLVEGLDDAQAFAQAFDDVLGLDVHGVVKSPAGRGGGLRGIPRNERMAPGLRDYRANKACTDCERRAARLW
jgi:hypothetical protein